MDIIHNTSTSSNSLSLYASNIKLKELHAKLHNLTKIREFLEGEIVNFDYNDLNNRNNPNNPHNLNKLISPHYGYYPVCNNEDVYSVKRSQLKMINDEISKSKYAIIEMEEYSCSIQTSTST
jgi:hypothetical protein